MAITKQQWANIDKELSHPYGSVDLLCDGYRVSLRVERTAKLKYSIITYVNGVWRGDWTKGDAEEAKRFLRPVARYLHTEKYRKEVIQIYGGKRCKKADLERINKKITLWHVEWSSVTALRRHFEKNNISLEVVRIGQASVQSAEEKEPA
jgi:hypothetical protein